MGAELRASDHDLGDLAHGSPPLVDVARGPTGFRLVRRLGAGGMSAVFLADLVGDAPCGVLWPEAPPRVAIKFLKPAARQQAESRHIDPASVLGREEKVLDLMAALHPPCEFVVGYYGSGSSLVEVAGNVQTLPWLAIELVEGGRHGATLTERVRSAASVGVDPVRALRLLRGIFEGAAALHAAGIIHRDIKPDNVLVAGAIDNETPKVADYGIARINGLETGLPAMTPAYGAPEQTLSMPEATNPLIGTWTDVHALATLAWFLLAGEHWCQSDSDSGWHKGARRSLLTANRLHEAFETDAETLEQIDAALARGAAHRLPECAFERTGTAAYVERARKQRPRMLEVDTEARFETVADLAGELLPLIERCAAAWRQKAKIECLPSTVVRPGETDVTRRLQVGICEVTWSAESAPGVSREALSPTAPGSVAFQPDGKVLVRFGAQLLYFVGDRPLQVAIPPEHRDTVAASTWLVRWPGGGFALAGPSHVLSIRGARFTPVALPERRGGGEIGAIQAVIGASDTFGVVTAETEDSNGGPELWTTSDGSAWASPVMLPLSGDVHALSQGPYGLLVVGSRRRQKGRALFMPFDGHANVYVAGVNAGPQLLAALCGVGREAWAAGPGVVLSLQRGAVLTERVEGQGDPVAMGLDRRGVPWLVTERAVMRRHADLGVATWLVQYEREADRAPLVAIGFTEHQARVLDARGDLVRLELDPS